MNKFQRFSKALQELYCSYGISHVFFRTSSINMSLFHISDRKVGRKKNQRGKERDTDISGSQLSLAVPPTGARAASTLHPTPTASGMADPNDPRREQPGKAATCFRLRLVNQLYQVACYCELIIAQSVTKQLKYYFMPVLQLAAQCLGHSIFLLT